jgi:16S rRNA processing protein RimM
MQEFGIIKSAFGVHGHVVIGHYLSNPQIIKKWEAIMIAVQADSHIPYFIENIKRINDNEIICKFDDIHTPEAAKQLSNCAVFTSPLVAQVKLTQNPHSDLIGFTVIDKAQQLKAIITDITSIGVQEYFACNYHEKELLIPIQSTFIQEVDAEQKCIYLQLPTGYLEAFTS